jgi:hypothetical protein
MSEPTGAELQPGTEKCPRTLCAIVIYNWLTRETRFFRNDDPAVREFFNGTKAFAPEEHIYFLSANLPWTLGQGAVFEAHMRVLREEWITALPLKEGESIKEYVASRIFDWLPSIVPPHSYGPGIGSIQANCQDTEHGYVTFSLPSPKGRRHFKVAVVEVCEEEVHD